MTMTTLAKDAEHVAGSIAIDNLIAGYGEHIVIQGVSAALAPGKVTAIIGPSGCGKTTLLRCLNRMTELTRSARVEGSITLDGADIQTIDPVLLRRRVGMVFQKPNPFPMSIKENILYGLKAQGARGKDTQGIVQASLERAALWDEVKDRLDKSALALSLGQQQRLCIARALAVNPEVVLMDEPAASLDPLSTSRLEGTILAMKGAFTVVIVTHDVQEAKRVSDYTMFMNRGNIVEFAETEVMFTSPEQPETKAYLEGRLLTAAVTEPVTEEGGPD